MRAESCNARSAALIQRPSRKIRSRSTRWRDRWSRTPGRGPKRDDSGIVKWIALGMMSDSPSRLRAVSWLNVPNGARAFVDRPGYGLYRLAHWPIEANDELYELQARDARQASARRLMPSSAACRAVK